jgi:hypothetical protein
LIYEFPKNYRNRARVAFWLRDNAKASFKNIRAILRAKSPAEVRRLVARGRRLSTQPSTLTTQPDRTCVHCGCTDSRACPGGCSWVVKHKLTNTGVCSSCN